jgi:hypothetical protein
MSALVSYADREFAAEVTDTGEGYRLWWTDHLANEWEEVYPDLAPAVARLALLIAAAPARRFFEGGTREWYAAWTAFADLNLTAPDRDN